jgi:hypothetical protein
VSTSPASITILIVCVRAAVCVCDRQDHEQFHLLSWYEKGYLLDWYGADKCCSWANCSGMTFSLLLSRREFDRVVLKTVVVVIVGYT